MKQHYLHLISLSIIGFFVFIAFGSLGDQASTSSNTPKTYGDNDNDKRLAYNYAQDFIKDRLKAPRSAKFAGIADKVNHVTYVRPNVYKIRSYVDSQNSFGAMIRSQWSCTIVFKGDTVSCTDIVIN